MFPRIVDIEMSRVSSFPGMEKIVSILVNIIPDLIAMAMPPPW